MTVPYPRFHLLTVLQPKVFTPIIQNTVYFTVAEMKKKLHWDRGFMDGKDFVDGYLVDYLSIGY